MVDKSGPNKWVQSSREVIEHKLLAALGDPDTVAIIASREDLDILIFALSQVAASGYSLAIPREPARELRAQEFGAGLEQLRREAFGE